MNNISVSRSMCDYLMYRYFHSGSSAYADKCPVRIVDLDFDRIPVKNSDQLLGALESMISNATEGGKAAIALSGGIDSAIMAKFMPKGSTAYTFRCVVPGVQVIDESLQAEKYAKECGLNHQIVDIHWEDVVSVLDKLMLHKGAPIHSIETQIYIASLRAKKDGFTKMLFGENADIIYGGMNGLLAENWYVGDFIDRYSYVLPYKVLRNPDMDFTPFYEFEVDGHIDGHMFINKYFRQEALGTYTNSCATAGMDFVGPYSRTVMSDKLDLNRIRSGDTKYIIREAFKKMYPGWELPQKIPMPRPMNEWMANWKGPTRDEFISNCHEKLTGDQKWMLYSLERFMNLMEDI